MTLHDINSRLVELRSQIDLPEVDLESIETEINNLLEEKRNLNDKAEKREALIQKALVENTPIVEQYEEREITKSMESKDLISTVEYRNEWLSAMKEERSINAAAIPGAIPQITLEKIVEKLRSTTPILDHISLFKVPGSFSLPVENVTNAAAIHTENNLITGAADTISQVLLNGYEITKLIRISRKALAMSIDAFEDYLVKKLAQYVGRRVSAYLISGTGDSQPQGVDFAATWTDTSNAVAFAGAVPTAAELVELVSYLPGGYASNAKFLMNHKTFWANVMAIRDDQKFPIAQKDGEVWRVLGYPVIVDDQVADGDFFFGDFEQLYANFAQDITVLRSEHSGLAYNAVDFLGACLFDSKVALSEAFVKGATTL